MSKLAFYINNVSVPPPDNWQQLDFEAVFEQGNSSATVRTINFEWKAENAKTLFTHFQQGNFGNIGIFEGLPFRLEGCEPPITLLEGAIDLSASEAEITCDIIKAPVRVNGIDFLNDIADSFSFAYLFETGVIAKSDFIAIPYVINSVPDYVQVAFLGFAVYELIKQLQQIIKETGTVIARIIGDTATAVASVGIASGTLGASITMLVLYIAYVTLLLLILLDIIVHILKNLLPSIKHKYGMRVSTLFQKAATHLGMGFSSTILQSSPYNNAVIIPKKINLNTSPQINETFMPFSIGNLLGGSGVFNRKNYDDATNPDAWGYYEGTFGDLIRSTEDIFNAKATVQGNSIAFEKWDFFQNQAQYTLPQISSQAPFDDPFGTNASEIASNYFLTWALDPSEFTTYNEYDGTNCQMILEPIVFQNKNNIFLKNLNEKRLQYALAKRKVSLTPVEKVADFFYQIAAAVFNGIANVLNAIINPINNVINAINNFFNFSIPTIPTVPTLPLNLITQRIGMMSLEKDFVGVQKFLIIDSNNKPSSSNQLLTSAAYLMDNFHASSFGIYTTSTSGSSVALKHNQWLTYKNKEIPLCCSDFLKIRNNNFIFTFDNKPARAMSVRWNPHTEIARVDYRVKEQYTTNLRNKYIIDGQ